LERYERIFDGVLMGKLLNLWHFVFLANVNTIQKKVGTHRVRPFLLAAPLRAEIFRKFERKIV
jgi:hypothetical protein